MRNKKLITFFLELLGLVAVFSLIATLEEEEEEEEEKADAPESKEAMSAWWNTFETKKPFPFYGILLCTESDIAASEVLTNYHTELGVLGGFDCCFIYFRDKSKAEHLTGFTSKEQVLWVNAIITLLDMDPRELPCFIFFKNLMVEELVIVSVKNMSSEQIIRQAREIFGYVRTHRTKRFSVFGRKTLVNAFEALTNFHSARKVKIATSKLLNGVKQVGDTTIYDLIKFFVPIPLH